MKKLIATIPSDSATQFKFIFDDPDTLSSLSLIAPTMSVHSFDAQTGIIEGVFTKPINAEIWVLQRAEFHMRFSQWAAALQLIRESPFKESLYHYQIIEKMVQNYIDTADTDAHKQKWQLQLEQISQKKKDIQSQFSDACRQMRAAFSTEKKESPIDIFFENFDRARYLNPHSFEPWILLLIMMPTQVDLATEPGLFDFAYTRFPIQLHNTTIYLAFLMGDTVNNGGKEGTSLTFHQLRLSQYQAILQKWYPLSIAVKQIRNDPTYSDSENRYNKLTNTAKLKLLSQNPIDALSLLSQAKQIATHSPFTYALMGMAHLQHQDGDIAKAYELYLKAVQAVDGAGQKWQSHILNTISHTENPPKEPKENHPDEVMVLDHCIRLVREKLKGDLQGVLEEFTKLTEWLQKGEVSAFCGMWALRFAVQLATEGLKNSSTDSKELIGKILEQTIISAMLVGHLMYRDVPTKETLDFIGQFFEYTVKDTGLTLNSYQVVILLEIPQPTDLSVAPMARFILQELSQEIGEQLGAKERSLTKKIIETLQNKHTAKDYYILIQDELPKVLAEILATRDFNALGSLATIIHSRDISLRDQHRPEIEAAIHHAVTMLLGPGDSEDLALAAPHLIRFTQSPIILGFLQSLKDKNISVFDSAVSKVSSSIPDLDLALMRITLSHHVGDKDQVKKYLKIARKLVATGEIPIHSDTPITHYLQWQLQMTVPKSYEHEIAVAPEKLTKMPHPQCLQGYEKPSTEILNRVWQTCIVMAQSSTAPIHVHVPNYRSGLSQLIEAAHLHFLRRPAETPIAQKTRLQELLGVNLKTFQKTSISTSIVPEESDSLSSATIPTQSQKHLTDRLKKTVQALVDERIATDERIPKEESKDYSPQEVKRALKQKNLKAMTQYTTDLATYQLEKDANPKTTKKPPTLDPNWIEAKNRNKFKSFLQEKAKHQHEILILRENCRSFLSQGNPNDMSFKLAYLAACAIQTMAVRDRKEATYDIFALTQQDAQWLHDFFYWDAIIHGEKALFKQHHYRPTDTASHRVLSQIEALWKKVEESCHGPEQHVFGDAPIQHHFNAGVFMELDKELRNIHLFFPA
jgi:hypothetical protein